MTPLVTAAEMNEIDSGTQKTYGIPAIALMEGAGIGAWRVVSEKLKRDDSVVFVAGKGNNGGDALVMARHCWCERRTGSVVLVVSESELSDLARTHANAIRKLGMPVYTWGADRDASVGELDSAALIVDGVLGTGLNGPARGASAEVIEAIRAASAFTVAVDVPSGAGDGWRPEWPVVRAQLCVTFGLPKQMLYMPRVRSQVGQIVRVPLTFARELAYSQSHSCHLVEESDVCELLPPMPADAYKGVRGRVGVFGGSTGMTGAPLLAAVSALRCGAGLASVICDPDLVAVIASYEASVMVKPVSGVEFGGAFDTVCVGPGWGTSGRDVLLREVVSSARRGVIDADGLRVLAGMDEPMRLGERWILTPHVGELAAMIGRSTDEVLDEWLGSVREASLRYDAVVVAKSHVTAVGTPDGRTWVIDGMAPALGTAGSGDVLAGAIAALLCRVDDAATAAIVGVMLHARAGRRAMAERGYFLSSDLPAALAAEVAHCEGSSGSPG